MRARDFLSREEQQRLIDAIIAAEKRTSGEIRIHIERKCPEDPKEGALRTFHKLHMEKTAQRNAVLIYVACESRRFAVLGDKGIDAVVPAGFWKDICASLSAHFSQGTYADGLAEAIGRVGEKLKTYFSYRSDDVNELPDEISFHENDGED